MKRGIPEVPVLDVLEAHTAVRPGNAVQNSGERVAVERRTESLDLSYGQVAHEAVIRS